MKKLLLLASVFAAGAISAQTIVNKGFENRNVVLEEFTGKTCGYCPDGHKRANEFAEANPGDVVLINIHCGGYAAGTPNYNVLFGEAPNQTNYGNILYRHPDVKLLGFPAGIVNRRHFQGYEQTSRSTPSNPGAISQSRASWKTTGAMVLGETSPVNVAVQSVYDPLAGRVYVKVEAFYTSSVGAGSSYLNVGILQNNIWGPQSGGSNLYPANYDGSRPSWSSTDPNSGRYKHMHMLRDVLTGQWGEMLTGTDAGSVHAKMYMWDVPEEINDITVDPLELEAYAFVTEGQMGIESGTSTKIEATQGEVDMNKALSQNIIDIVGVDDVEEEENATKIYPNPSTGSIFVKLGEGNINDVNINVYTATGQKVVESSTEQLNEKTVKLDISNFIDGFYFVEVSNGESVIARETVIKR